MPSNSVEFFCGASPEYFEKPLSEEQEKYSRKKASTRASLTGKKSLRFTIKQTSLWSSWKSADLYSSKRDGQTPHVVAYAVPLDHEKRLNCKSHPGGREKLSALQNEYAEAMKPLGLQRGIRGSQAEHQKVKTRYGKIELLDEAFKDRDRMAEMFEQTTRLLQHERGRLDVELVKITKILPLPEHLVETKKGIAILSRSNPSEVSALVTPLNKAFDAAGKQISDGSSLKLLEHLAPPDAKIERLTNLSAQRFGDETAKSAVKNFAGEIINDLGEPIEAPKA